MADAEGEPLPLPPVVADGLLLPPEGDEDDLPFVVLLPHVLLRVKMHWYWAEESDPVALMQASNQ